MRNESAASREQIRQLDRIAIEQYGVEGVILMENAGRSCARAAAEMLAGLAPPVPPVPPVPSGVEGSGVEGSGVEGSGVEGSPAEGADGKKVTILCGRGNNGGDGFVVARHLSNWGADVEVLLLARTEDLLRRSNETSTNLRIILHMGVPVRQMRSGEQVVEALRERADSDLLVDGLLGTGAQGELREPFRSAIQAVNQCECPVLAIDVPSGLDCDTGRPLGVAVRADRTVTFVCNKLGFTRPGAHEYTGQVEVAEISIPRDAIEKLLPNVSTKKPRRARRTRRKEFDELSNRVIGCALEVHRTLGPGLLESTYEQCLARELSAAGIAFRTQCPVPVEYKGLKLDCGYRVDFLVDENLILELKSVDELLPVHQAQLLTYMKLAGVAVGLLINFNVELLKNGIRRFVL